MTPGDAWSLTVVIPARDAATSIDRCLAAIRSQSETIPIVVVDAGTDDTSRRALAWNATVLKAPGASAARARNAGAASVSSDVVAFVDADNEVGSGWLEACHEAFGDPSIDAAGQPYRTVESPTWVQATYDSLRRRPVARESVEWLGAGNLAIRRAAFEAIGGFDVSLEACEDVDLCRRLRSAGARLVAVPAMVSVHLGDPPTLGALFRGELWRGRDNLRVSLRPPFAWRELPGTALPVVWLAVVALALAAFASGNRIAIATATLGAAVVVTASVLRAITMIGRGALRSPRQWLQALVVALVYDAARALSLLTRTTHRVRQARTP